MLGLSAEMVGDLLDQGQEVVIEVAVDGGAFEHPDLGQGAQLRLGRARPIQGRRAVDGRIRQAEQRPTQQMVLLRQHDPGAGARRGEGGRQPGRPGADHQHVAVGLCLVVAVRVALAWRLAHAGGMTDEMLVLHPHGGGPHEGLVVEAGGKNPRRQIVQRADIVFQARPTVLGARREAVHQLHQGRQLVGVGARILAQLHQRVGLLEAGGENTARAMIFEAAADEVHPVGEQGRGQAVAAEPAVVTAVETEAERALPVDLPALWQSERLGHVRRPFLRRSPSWARAAAFRPSCRPRESCR